MLISTTTTNNQQLTTVSIMSSYELFQQQLSEEQEGEENQPKIVTRLITLNSNIINYIKEDILKSYPESDYETTIIFTSVLLESILKVAKERIAKGDANIQIFNDNIFDETNNEEVLLELEAKHCRFSRVSKRNFFHYIQGERFKLSL